MKLVIEVPWDKINNVASDIEQIENVTSVNIQEKNIITGNILDRKPNNQIELFEIILSIVLSITSEEVYSHTKKKILKYLADKKLKVKVVQKIKDKETGNAEEDVNNEIE